MSEEEGIRQFESQFGDLDPELESSFRKYITERDEPYYEAINKRLLPSHLQDCIKEGVCPNKGYTPTPPTPTQQAEMNRDKQEWGAKSMLSGSTLASIGGVLALGAGLTYGVGLNTFFNRIRSAETIQGGIRGKNVRDEMIQYERNAVKSLQGAIRGKQGRDEIREVVIPRNSAERLQGAIRGKQVRDENREANKMFPEVPRNDEVRVENVRTQIGSIPSFFGSFVPQQAKEETTQSSQETISVVPSFFK